MAPRITLTTDFGTRDPYVAAMKGVISTICPEAALFDLSHDIAPQAIAEGALFVAGAAPWFPAGTVHVVVVDPGVGSDRRAVAVRAGGQVFICPDNGLLTLFLRQHPVEEARFIEERRYMHTSISPTFHGRDVFAPVGAHVARGVPLAELGPAAERLVALDWPEPERLDDGRIRGVVVHVDRFGNLITNIPESMVRAADVEAARVWAASRGPWPVRRTYSDAPRGEALALFGSAGYLEIGVNGGSAAAALNLGLKDCVEVSYPA